MRRKPTLIHLLFLIIFVPSCSLYFDIDSNLLLAASEGDTDKVESLLAFGADVDIKDDSGKTALMMAVEGGYIRTVKILLDKDIQINARDNDGWTALSIAEYRGHTKIIELLKLSGATSW